MHPVDCATVDGVTAEANAEGESAPGEWVGTFLEIRADDEGISRAVAARGVPTFSSLKLGADGFDSVRGAEEVRQLCWNVVSGGVLEKGEFLQGGGPCWKLLHTLPRQIAVHICVPRRLFRRAADRRARTRLRSVSQPWGDAPADSAKARTLLAENALAIRIAELARWLHGIGGTLSVESPADSHLWPLLESWWRKAPAQDVYLNFCVFGSTHRMPTRIRVYGEGGFDLSPLSVQCRRVGAGLRAATPSTRRWVSAVATRRPYLTRPASACGGPGWLRNGA